MHMHIYWPGFKTLNNFTFLFNKIESQQDRVNFQADLLLLQLFEQHWATQSKIIFNVAECVRLGSNAASPQLIEYIF